MESQLANTQWSDTNNLCPGEFNTTCLQVWITRNVLSSCCESPNSELPLAKHVMQQKQCIFVLCHVISLYLMIEQSFCFLKERFL